MGHNQPQRRPRRKYFSQEGVALIAVSVALSIAGVFVTEFSTNTNVDLYAAKNAENDMKAHFLAQSSMNLSHLIITLERRFDNASRQMQASGGIPGMGGLGAFKITDYAGAAMKLFGSSQEEASQWAQAFGGFAADSIETLGVPEGQFSVEITSEDGKINVNCGYNSTSREAEVLYAQLWGLLRPDAYNPIFENEDGENWRRDRETQIAAIIDYVDTGRTRYEPGDSRSSAPEDYGYESLTDKYESKNNRIDTVGEIKQIRGVDDRLWNLLGGNLTVYGDCTLKISEINDPGMIAAILFYAAQDPNDSIFQNQQRLWTLARAVLYARDMGYPMETRDDFKRFVENPVQELEQVLLFVSQDPNAGGQPEVPFDIQQLQPVPLNPTELGKIVTSDQQRRTYRVEAIATIGLMEKRIIGIWDFKAPTNQDTRYPGNVENPGERGAWVYWRED